MPRRYRLGERAEQVQATHNRIIDAAIELYLEVGISAATMRDIGTRADVAPGTLRNHFPTREALDRAIIERVTSGIALPDRSIFEGAHSLDERLAGVIRAGGTFAEQAGQLYRMWRREPMLTGPWVEKGAQFGARWDEFMRAALGPNADDEALAVLRAVLHPEFFDSIRGGHRSTDEAVALITSVIVPWFEARIPDSTHAD